MSGILVSGFSTGLGLMSADLLVGKGHSSCFTPATPSGLKHTGSGKGSTSSPFATSLPGIFAVGDVRAGSVKRVASSVGEGSVVISTVWEFLSTAKPDHDARQAAKCGSGAAADELARKSSSGRHQSC